ncbi:MAG: putative Ig domain-containing protein [Desulfuromonadaceae bacterium]
MTMQKWISALILTCLTAVTLSGCGNSSDSSTPVADSGTVVLKNSALPGATQNAAYTTFLGASGGKAPYKWSVVTGNLPMGLTLSTDGNITGTPTALGTYTVVFKVSDSSTTALVAQKALQINVSTLVFTPGTTGTGLYADHCAYCHATIGSTGQQHKDATLAQVKAAIAADTGGMGEFGASGVFPLTDAQLNLIITAMKGTSAYVPPTFTITTLPAATVGVAYSQTLTAKDGTKPYVWSTMGGDPIPAGLSLNPATGALSGTPTTAGVANVMFMLEDAKAGTMVHQSIAITVNAVAVPPDGVALFNSKCASCHGGSVAAYNHKGSSAVTIQTAIDSKIGSMNSATLKALTPAEIAAIATAVQ